MHASLETFRSSTPASDRFLSHFTRTETQPSLTNFPSTGGALHVLWTASLVSFGPDFQLSLVFLFHKTGPHRRQQTGDQLGWAATQRGALCSGPCLRDHLPRPAALHLMSKGLSLFEFFWTSVCLVLPYRTASTHTQDGQHDAAAAKGGPCHQGSAFDGCPPPAASSQVPATQVGCHWAPPGFPPPSLG